MDMQLYDWQRVAGGPVGSATFRQQLSDFQVSETLRFEASGQGAHHLLLIEKKNLNTDMVSTKLRRFADVKPMDVGYAGKKDRFAITKQWFSVQLPMLREIDWQELNDEQLQVLSHTRHDKKLRIGAVKENHFSIVLRDFVGDKELLEQRLKQIAKTGFANYFGEQRFGHNGDNLPKAQQFLSSNKRMKNRNLKGLLLSSARSFLFNHVLSERIAKQQFNSLLDGDFVQLDGSEKGFLVEDLTAEVERFVANDIHPTGPLVGRGRLAVNNEALLLEQQALEAYTETIEQLTNKGLNAERRSIRVFANNVSCEWLDEQTLQLKFSLGKGSYATSLLRELVTLKRTV